MSISHSELVSESRNFYHPTLTLPVQGGKKAFTLAEVLITLVIIGVIAAITIPTMMNSKNNEELRAGLLKAQSTLAGALEMYYLENGNRLVFSDFSNDSHSLKNKIMKYIATAQDCGIHECVGDNQVYKTFDNRNQLRHTYLDDGQFIMNDGMTVFLENPGYGMSFILVDVNGYKKKPNRAGYDLFGFQINSKGNLIPMGTSGYYFSNPNYCSYSNESLDNGFGCTAKALSDPNYFKNLH